jgi:hypothetical protein
MCALIIQRREEAQREKGGRTDPLIWFEERSFVAMLLRTDSLIGNEERSFDSLRSLRINILVGYLVNNKTPTPYVFHKC